MTWKNHIIFCDLACQSSTRDREGEMASTSGALAASWAVGQSDWSTRQTRCHHKLRHQGPAFFSDSAAGAKIWTERIKDTAEILEAASDPSEPDTIDESLDLFMWIQWIHGGFLK